MNIKQERIKRGLTQKELAQKLDLCALTVSNLENDKLMTRVSKARKKIEKFFREVGANEKKHIEEDSGNLRVKFFNILTRHVSEDFPTCMEGIKVGNEIVYQNKIFLITRVSFIYGFSDFKDADVVCFVVPRETLTI